MHARFRLSRVWLIVHEMFHLLHYFLDPGRHADLDLTKFNSAAVIDLLSLVSGYAAKSPHEAVAEVSVARLAGRDLRAELGAEQAARIDQVMRALGAPQPPYRGRPPRVAPLTDADRAFLAGAVRSELERRGLPALADGTAPDDLRDALSVYQRQLTLGRQVPLIADVAERRVQLRDGVVVAFGSVSTVVIEEEPGEELLEFARAVAAEAAGTRRPVTVFAEGGGSAPSRRVEDLVRFTVGVRPAGEASEAPGREAPVTEAEHREVRVWAVPEELAGSSSGEDEDAGPDWSTRKGKARAVEPEEPGSGEGSGGPVAGPSWAAGFSAELVQELSSWELSGPELRQRAEQIRDVRAELPAVAVATVLALYTPSADPDAIIRDLQQHGEHLVGPAARIRGGADSDDELPGSDEGSGSDSDEEWTSSDDEMAGFDEEIPDNAVLEQVPGQLGGPAPQDGPAVRGEAPEAGGAGLGESSSPAPLFLPQDSLPAGGAAEAPGFHDIAPSMADFVRRVRPEGRLGGPFWEAMVTDERPGGVLSPETVDRYTESYRRRMNAELGRYLALGGVRVEPGISLPELDAFLTPRQRALYPELAVYLELGGQGQDSEGWIRNWPENGHVRRSLQVGDAVVTVTHDPRDPFAETRIEQVRQAVERMADAGYPVPGILFRLPLFTSRVELTRVPNPDPGQPRVRVRIHPDAAMRADAVFIPPGEIFVTLIGAFTPPSDDGNPSVHSTLRQNGAGLIDHEASHLLHHLQNPARHADLDYTEFFPPEVIAVLRRVSEYAPASGAEAVAEVTAAQMHGRDLPAELGPEGAALLAQVMRALGAPAPSLPRRPLRVAPLADDERAFLAREVGRELEQRGLPARAGGAAPEDLHDALSEYERQLTVGRQVPLITDILERLIQRPAAVTDRPAAAGLPPADFGPRPARGTPDRAPAVLPGTEEAAGALPAIEAAGPESEPGTPLEVPGAAERPRGGAGPDEEMAGPGPDEELPDSAFAPWMPQDRVDGYRAIAPPLADFLRRVPPQAPIVLGSTVDMLATDERVAGMLSQASVRRHGRASAAEQHAEVARSLARGGVRVERGISMAELHAFMTPQQLRHYPELTAYLRIHQGQVYGPEWLLNSPLRSHVIESVPVGDSAVTVTYDPQDPFRDIRIGLVRRAVELMADAGYPVPDVQFRLLLLTRRVYVTRVPDPVTGGSRIDVAVQDDVSLARAAQFINPGEIVLYLLGTSRRADGGENASAVADTLRDSEVAIILHELGHYWHFVQHRQRFADLENTVFRSPRVIAALRQVSLYATDNAFEAVAEVTLSRVLRRDLPAELGPEAAGLIDELMEALGAPRPPFPARPPRLTPLTADEMRYLAAAVGRELRPPEPLSEAGVSAVADLHGGLPVYQRQLALPRQAVLIAGIVERRRRLTRGVAIRFGPGSATVVEAVSGGNLLQFARDVAEEAAAGRRAVGVIVAGGGTRAGAVLVQLREAVTADLAGRGVPADRAGDLVRFTVGSGGADRRVVRVSAVPVGMPGSGTGSGVELAGPGPGGGAGSSRSGGMPTSGKGKGKAKAAEAEEGSGSEGRSEEPEASGSGHSPAEVLRELHAWEVSGEELEQRARQVLAVRAVLPWVPVASVLIYTASADPGAIIRDQREFGGQSPPGGPVVRWGAAGETGLAGAGPSAALFPPSDSLPGAGAEASSAEGDLAERIRGGAGSDEEMADPDEEFLPFMRRPQTLVESVLGYTASTASADIIADLRRYGDPAARIRGGAGESDSDSEQEPAGSGAESGSGHPAGAGSAWNGDDSDDSEE
jgi:hypothetical protein